MQKISWLTASWLYGSVNSFWKCLISSKNPDFKLPKTKLIYSLSCFWTTNWKSLRKSLPPQSAVVPRWCNHFPNIACCWWLSGSPIGRGRCQSRDVTRDRVIIVNSPPALHRRSVPSRLLHPVLCSCSENTDATKPSDRPPKTADQTLKQS